MAAHLSYGRVNLNAARGERRCELREFLDKCAGSKVRTVRGDTAVRLLHPGPGPLRVSSFQGGEPAGTISRGEGPFGGASIAKCCGDAVVSVAAE